MAGYSRVRPPQSSPDNNDDLSSLYSYPSIQNSPDWPSVLLSPASVRTLNQSDDGTYRDDISSLANFSNEDIDPSDLDSVFTANMSASHSNGRLSIFLPPPHELRVVEPLNHPDSPYSIATTVGNGSAADVPPLRDLAPSLPTPTPPDLVPSTPQTPRRGRSRRPKEREYAYAPAPPPPNLEPPRPPSRARDYVSVSAQPPPPPNLHAPNRIAKVQSNHPRASTHLSEFDILAPIDQQPSEAQQEEQEDELEYVDAPTERIPRQPIAPPPPNPPLQRRATYDQQPSRGPPPPRRIVLPAPLRRAEPAAPPPPQPQPNAYNHPEQQQAQQGQVQDSSEDANDTGRDDQPPSLLGRFLSAPNMVDRTTHLQNSLYQTQENGNSTRAEVDIPPDTCERQVKNVQEQFWVNDQYGRRKPNAEFLRDHFLHEGRLTEVQALAILRQSTGVLTAEPNVLKVKSPVTVVGDIHGQYYDLMKIFEVGGNLKDTNYLFLGNYVDRGYFGIECLLYLYTLKLWHPDRIFLIRGHHECRHLTTEYFIFKRECLHKYSEKVYDACIESFFALPLSGLLDGKFFCVHGGISPELNTVSDIDRIMRFQEPGSSGLLCDLLWADPVPNFGHEAEPSQHPSPVPPGQMWGHNTKRGGSYYFTYEAVIKFLERNELLGVIRGHEVQDAGYVMFRKTPIKKFPSVITVFSAPNLLDKYHNRGAVLKYANNSTTIRQYHANPHPFWLPNFMDAFTWSLPFVGAKIIEMLLAILSVCSPEELEAEYSSSDEEAERNIVGEATLPDASARRQQIRNKILAVGRMQRMFQLLREEAENASELSAGPVGTDSALISNRGGMDDLGVQGNQIQRYIHSFDNARHLDIANERLPEYDYTPTSFPYVPIQQMQQPLAVHSSEDGEVVAYEVRRQQIKDKILAVGRMQRMFQTLREEAENSYGLSAGLVGMDSAPISNRGGMDALRVQGNAHVQRQEYEAAPLPGGIEYPVSPLAGRLARR
ncbi:Metallo-dependent phosphatase-like protein [Lactarius tabidus]